MSAQHHPGPLQLLNHCLGQPVDDGLRQHIRDCQECRQRVEQLQEERRQASAELRPAAQLEAFAQAGHARSRGLRWAFWVPVAVAGMALLMVMFVWPNPSEPKPEPSRLKGLVDYQVYVQREGRVQRADAGFRYRPSDKIRLGLVSPHPILVTVLARQPGGYSPISSLADIPVTPGGEMLLPGSLSLDCRRGSETLQLRIRQAEGGARLHQRHIVLECERP